LRTVDNWRANPHYLRAVDLFNFGYYWEAHEAWEGLWIAAGRTGPVADALKGLIKLAAAGVKAYEGRPAGVRRHARRALELLDAACPDAEGRLLAQTYDELLRLASNAADECPNCGSRLPPVAGLMGLMRISGPA
jgi:predicted metal-dependent hydrolase